MYIRGIIRFKDHSGVWPKVSLIFKDFKFKISEGYNQNGSFPVSTLLAWGPSTSILLVAF